MSEKRIRNQIMNELGKDPCLLVLSNPSGVADFADIETGKSYKVNYGLGGIPGGPDLIVLLHWKHIAGLRGCQPIGIEVKRPGEVPRPNQEAWRRNAARWGMQIEACTEVKHATDLIDLTKKKLIRAGLMPERASAFAYSVPG